MKKQIQSIYNSGAVIYKNIQTKSANNISELPTVLRLLGEIQNKNILDIGCGFGRHAKEFLDRGATVTGFDIAENFVESSKIYCQNRGNFFQGDFEEVNFPANSFDIVNASYCLHYSAKIPELMPKILSWVKPGGICTFSIVHPIWLMEKIQNIDLSKKKKFWFNLTDGLKVFNYYYPLDTYIQAINAGNCKVLNIIETIIPRRYKNWPDNKYRLPMAFVFKVIKVD